MERFPNLSRVHFHALQSFVLGCGIAMEVDLNPVCDGLSDDGAAAAVDGGEPFRVGEERLEGARGLLERVADRVGHAADCSSGAAAISPARRRSIPARARTAAIWAGSARAGWWSLSTTRPSA